MPVNSNPEKINQGNRQIIWNIIGSFFVKGCSIFVVLYTTPAYMRYFANDKVLGIWFVILSLLSWILYFDLGIGNGLRNKLPEIISKKDYTSARAYISSAYIAISAFVFTLWIIFFLFERFIDWNAILDISTDHISKATLSSSMKIAITGILVYFISGLVVPLLYALQKAAITSFISLSASISILFYIQFAPRQDNMEANLIALSWANAILTNLPYILATIILFASALRKAIPSFFHFSIKKAREIFKVGLILLCLQIIFAVVSRTHEFLINRFINSEAVVEYNAYNKLFSAIASIFILVLLPIWSAVTKAQAEKRYVWIRKIHKILFFFVIATFLLDLAVLPFLQFGMDIWLGENSISVHIKYAIIMSFFNTIFILHSVNTTICNGLSKFKIQIIWMSVAAVLAIPLSWLFCQITGNWTGVIMGCGLSMLPYEFIQPFFTSRYLDEKAKEIRIDQLLKNLEIK